MFNYYSSAKVSGFGTLTSQRNHDHVTLGSCTINTRSVGQERSAVASGGVVNATTNFTLAQSTDAVIELAASGELQKDCS